MKHILCILAVLPLIATCFGPKESAVKGDLSYFDLRGNVKSMSQDGATFNFDKDGRLIIPKEDGQVEIGKEPGDELTYYTYTPVAEEDPFSYWGVIRPFKRGYDKNGVLKFIAFHYEMGTYLYYNDDGTVSREDWGEESWGGCAYYNYMDGMRVSAVSQSGEVATFSGVIDEEMFWDDFVCFSYDECGNWTSRFEVTHYNGTVHGNISRRTIEYYSKDAPASYSKPLEGLVLSGEIGVDARMCIMNLDDAYSGAEGFYQLDADGVEIRQIKSAYYDKASGRLVMKASDRYGSEIGSFDGIITLKPGKSTYKGTFSNSKGRSVEFSLSE